jgi:hypothetical protein
MKISWIAGALSLRRLALLGVAVTVAVLGMALNAAYQTRQKEWTYLPIATRVKGKVVISSTDSLERFDLEAADKNGQVSPVKLAGGPDEYYNVAWKHNGKALVFGHLDSIVASVPYSLAIRVTAGEPATLSDS